MEEYRREEQTCVFVLAWNAVSANYNQETKQAVLKILSIYFSEISQHSTIGPLLGIMTTFFMEDITYLNLQNYCESKDKQCFVVMLLTCSIGSRIITRIMFTSLHVLLLHHSLRSYSTIMTASQNIISYTKRFF